MTQEREFEPLAQRYIDGQATAEDVERLNRRLRDDPQARRTFVELMNVDSALTAVLVDATPQADERRLPQAVVRGPAPAASKRSVGGPAAARWAVVAAACVMLLVGGLWWRHAFSQGFATVHSGAGVVELPEGTVLRDDWHTIGEGAIELMTARGARVVIEAPARFRFESAQRLHMTRGRLAAEVPESATGFTVITPSGQAVDLGTKFGIDVPLEKQTEIHVFEGEVITQASDGSQRRNLTGGEALVLNAESRMNRDIRSAAFIQPDEVASLSAALAAGQHTHSDSALARLRRDPALIALFDFESDDLPEGAYRTVQGRWPGSSAPEFVNKGDHMKLDVGGDRQWPQLTLAAWVRLDRLGDPFQSLLHTDGWDHNKAGQVHWMVTRHTTMRLALSENTLAPGAEETEGFPDLRTSVLPEQGRWVHLATVYDSEKRTVRFYLNGKFDKQTRQAIAHPARLGPAQIGNWNQQDRKLSGRVDELLILGRAMSDDEVAALYAAGNPYR